MQLSFMSANYLKIILNNESFSFFETSINYEFTRIWSYMLAALMFNVYIFVIKQPMIDCALKKCFELSSQYYIKFILMNAS